MASTRILTLNPLCAYERGHCPKRAKAVVGPELLWHGGGGSQQNVWCCKCPTYGVISRNFQKQSHNNGIVIHDRRAPMEESRCRT